MIFNDSKYNQTWAIKKLNQLGSFQRGISKHRPRNDKILFENGTYPFIQTGEIKNAILYVDHSETMYNDFGLKQSKLWDSGTLCITIAANIAESAILKKPMCFPDSIVGFIANPNETTPEFMYYIFEYIKQQIQQRTLGSIQDNINIDYLQTLRFRIPPHQNKIANFLSSIDKKINLNKKINATLEEMAKTIYLHKFFRKPANGRLGDIIIENAKSSIPVGEVKNIKGEYPFFTSGDAILQCDKALVDGRNIFLNTGGNSGVKFFVGKAAYSTDTWSVTAKNFSDYLYMFLKTIQVEIYKKFFAGTALKHLQKDLLKMREIYIPTESELEKFNAEVQPGFTMISKNLMENRKLAEMRDFLLPLLMNGQIGFRD